MRINRRDHLINTAISLFCENGYHATGIDKLIEKAGVSKKTMYQHFRSKEELIYAALKQYDSVFRNNFMKAVESTKGTATEKLLAIFDVAEDWFSDDNFYGCMFINAISEYSEQNSPVRDISKQFKQLMWNYVSELVKEAGIIEHETLTDELCLLLEGAIVTAQVSQKQKAAKTAKKIAALIIEEKFKQQKDKKL